MDPKRGNLDQLNDDQRAQIVAALGPIMAEIINIKVEYNPISFSDILIRKFGEQYELSINFWPKDN